MVRVQVGLELTRASLVDPNQTFGGDGTSKDHTEIVSFVIETSVCSIAGIPWTQGSKAGEGTATNCCREMDRCHRSYNDFYAHVKATLNAEEFKALAWPVPVEVGLFITKIRNTVSDHAGNEHTRVVELQRVKTGKVEELKIYADLTAAEKQHIAPINETHCKAHFRNLLVNEAAKAMDAELAKEKHLGKQAGEAELGGSTAFLTGVLNQLFKQFGHLSKAYAFGHGVIDFPSWMQTSHPGKWHALKHFIGNRADILCKNSFLAHYMIPFYVEYLDWLVLELKTTCALHVRLRTKLLTEEFEAEMRAAGILWYHLIQPLRVMIRSKEAGLSMLDFNAYAQKLYIIAEELEKDPSFLLFDSYKAYDFHDKVTAIVDKYRVRNAVQC
jgi:hypothetical protein